MCTSQTSIGDTAAPHHTNMTPYIHTSILAHIYLDSYRHGLSCNGSPSRHASIVIYDHSSEAEGDKKNNRKKEKKRDS